MATGKAIVYLVFASALIGKSKLQTAQFLSFELSLSPYKCWPVTAVFSLNVPFEPSQLYFLLDNFARDYFIPLSPQRKKKVRFNCDSFGNNLRPFFSFRFIELCCGYQLGFACCPLFLKLSPGAGNKIIIIKKNHCAKTAGHLGAFLGVSSRTN